MENILTAAGVQMMIEVEQEVFESVEYQEYCQLDADGACTGYEMVFLFFLFSILAQKEFGMSVLRARRMLELLCAPTAFDNL